MQLRHHSIGQAVCEYVEIYADHANLAELEAQGWLILELLAPTAVVEVQSQATVLWSQTKSNLEFPRQAVHLIGEADVGYAYSMIRQLSLHSCVDPLVPCKCQHSKFSALVTLCAQSLLCQWAVEASCACCNSIAVAVCCPLLRVYPLQWNIGALIGCQRQVEGRNSDWPDCWHLVKSRFTVFTAFSALPFDCGW